MPRPSTENVRSRLVVAVVAVLLLSACGCGRSAADGGNPSDTTAELESGVSSENLGPSPYGSWKVVEAWYAGGPSPELIGCVLTIPRDDDKLTFDSPQQGTYRFAYRLDRAKRYFEYTVLFSTVYGIYRIEGDRLTLCLGSERPQAFRSTPENQTRLLVLDRVEPADAPSDR
ncbi:MAG: hypothetical protein D6741_18290 [Planctomycetota bacterium]|nr:MAG: hypothetical protein D6741_18290 [Planctomycetota bacterium]